MGCVIKQRHPAQIHLRGKMFDGQLAFDRVLALGQPVHRGVDLVGGGAGQRQVDPQGGLDHRASVDSFDFGRITQETINPSARSRDRHASYRFQLNEQFRLRHPV
jgi:hypothetical protein